MELGVAQQALFLDKAAHTDPLLRGFFLKPPQTVIETLMLRDHRAYLPKDVLQCVLMAQNDGCHHPDVIAHLRLIRADRAKFGEYALKLRAEKFKRDVLSHGK